MRARAIGPLTYRLFSSEVHCFPTDSTEPSPCRTTPGPEATGRTEPAVLIWQSDSAQENGKDGQPDEVRGAARESASSRQQATGSLAGRVELTEQAPQVVRQ